MSEATGTENPGNARSDVEAWRDPYARRGPRYYEDEQGNSASRPVLLTEEAAGWRERLVGADTDPGPLDFVRISRLRMLIAKAMLDEFAARLEGVPGTESYVELLGTISNDLWDASPDYRDLGP